VPRVADAVEAMLPERNAACELIDQLVLDFRGNVTLCCAVYDGTRNHIGHYLDMDWAELQRSKYAHSTCSSCTSAAAHVLYTHFSNPELVARMRSLVDAQLAAPPSSDGRRMTVSLPILSPSQAAAPLAKSA